MALASCHQVMAAMDSSDLYEPPSAKAGERFRACVNEATGLSPWDMSLTFNAPRVTIPSDQSFYSRLRQ